MCNKDFRCAGIGKLPSPVNKDYNINIGSILVTYDLTAKIKLAPILGTINI